MLLSLTLWPYVEFVPNAPLHSLQLHPFHLNLTFAAHCAAGMLLIKGDRAIPGVAGVKMGEFNPRGFWENGLFWSCLVCSCWGSHSASHLAFLASDDNINTPTKSWWWDSPPIVSLRLKQLSPVDSWRSWFNLKVLADCIIQKETHTFQCLFERWQAVGGGQ